MNARSLIGGLLCGLVLTMCAGCGDDGKYTVSGAVTYKGEPVPAGEIRFTPDTAQGNTGPMVLALIKDGRYETPEDKGVVGGAYQLRVTGYAAAGASADPTAPDFGRQLFPIHRTTVDFPKEDHEHDIVID